jgi:hypothetical protein
MSIKEMLEEAPEVAKGPRANDYIWKQIWGGSKEIRAYHDARTVLNWVELRIDELDHMNYDYNEERNPLYGTGVLGYGDSFNDFKDAIQYTDGTILACIVLNTWGGTFQSHDDVCVKYFTLTPKIQFISKKALARTTRKKK